MSTENIITIFTALAFGPAMAVVLLRWVLARATKQDELLQSQSVELAALRQRIDSLEGRDRNELQSRMDKSTAVEEKLVCAVDRICGHAERLCNGIAALERRLDARTCQLPDAVLARVREWMQEYGRAGPS